MQTICIDIDGVIAIPNNDKWEVEHFLLAEGAKEGLEKLSKDFLIILHSARGPYQLDKTVEWLKKHDIYQYIYQVHLGKPLAEYYIDDKAVHHSTWDITLQRIQFMEESKVRRTNLTPEMLETDVPNYNWKSIGEHHNKMFNKMVQEALIKEQEDEYPCLYK